MPPSSPPSADGRRPLLVLVAALLVLGLVAARAQAAPDQPGLPNMDASGTAPSLDPTLPPEPLSRRIPAVAYDAYQRAAEASPTVAAGCEVDWYVLAGIGKVESDHGRWQGRQIAEDGLVSPPIYGPQLNGSQGTMAIPDSDGGELDGDTEWDRAVGPMQFIPESWARLGRDGTGNGEADPNNIYDAALSAVAHLCIRRPGDYDDPAQLRRAILGYNASEAYADRVLAWAEHYAASREWRLVYD